MLSNPQFKILPTTHPSTSATFNLGNLDYAVILTLEPMPGLCPYYDCYRTDFHLFCSLSQ